MKNLFQNRRPVSLPVSLTRRRIYILPTRSGMVFVFFLLAMLVAAINYTNNLAFLLTFLLGSMALVSAVHTYANMAGLCVEDVRLLPAFCGEEARLRILFRAGGRPRGMLTARVGAASIRFSLEALGESDVSLHLPALKRGRLPLGRLTISTRYPLGLFRAWSPLQLSVSGLVYPKPLPPDLRIRQLLGGQGDEGLGGMADSSGEVSEIRPYQPGDHLSRISWKASARGMGLFSKEFQARAARTVFLDWNALAGFGYEERISRLAGLVLEAEREGRRYALRLPGGDIAPGAGAVHAHTCLEALALMPEES